MSFYRSNTWKNTEIDTQSKKNKKEAVVAPIPKKYFSIIKKFFENLIQVRF